MGCAKIRVQSSGGEGGKGEEWEEGKGRDGEWEEEGCQGNLTYWGGRRAGSPAEGVGRVNGGRGIRGRVGKPDLLGSRRADSPAEGGRAGGE